MTAAVAVPVYRTSIGKKAVMAVTGVILYGFVVVHIIGNLKVFLGPTHFNDYADFLRRIGAPALGNSWFLWIMRTVLFTSVILHIWAAYATARQSQTARPVDYVKTRRVQANPAALTMRWGGLVILFFVIYHILHFTTGTVHPDYIRGNVYHNVVAGFRVWPVSIFYIVAMFCLAMHLYHGIWSIFQTAGRNSQRTDRAIRSFATVSAVAIFLGASAVPVGVLTHVVK